jgi:hypothetical protein
MARHWRRAGYGHTNFALVVAAWKRKKKQRRKRPYLSGTGRRRRSGASSRGGGTTCSSKCGRWSSNGGTTSGRGTTREARGNAHRTNQACEKTRRRARSGSEADRGYLTLREGATRYGQFPRRTLLGSLVNRGNEVASYYVGKRLTVRLVRLARWVSRGAGGATRRAPHAGRPRSLRQTGA